MLDTYLLSDPISLWLSSVKKCFEEFICLADENRTQEVELDLDTYHRVFVENGRTESFTTALQNSNYLVLDRDDVYSDILSKLFVHTWPLYHYLSSINYICGNKNIFDKIIACANDAQKQKLTKMLLTITLTVSQQNVIFNLFVNDRNFTKKWLEQWNANQKILFKNIVKFFSVCTCVYFGEHFKQLKDFFSAPESAKKIIDGLLGQHSKFVENSRGYISQARRYDNIYFWVRVFSALGIISSFCFINFASNKLKDNYVLILVISVIAFIGTYIHKQYLERKKHNNEEGIMLLLNTTRPGPKFNPELNLADFDFQTDFLEFPEEGATLQLGLTY